MKLRTVAKIVRPVTTSDGGGVVLKRGIANAEISDLDPFLLFDHFGSENPDDYIAGFPMHPHRGIETVTYMLKGAIKHKDSSGNEGVIQPGGVQWMTAGSGIMHEEMPETLDGEMEGFQLWVNLPAEKKMRKPRYQEFKDQEIPRGQFDGGEVKVIAGQFEGIDGSISGIDAAPNYLDIFLEPNRELKHKIPEGHQAFAYVYEGSVAFSETGSNVKAPNIIVFNDGDLITAESGDNESRFLLVSGAPFNEPIARYGPFVMNTREEIQTALSDLQKGTFVKSFD